MDQPAHDKLVLQMKALLEEGGKEATMEEAEEAARNITGYFSLLYDFWREDQLRKRRLKDNPKGFLLEGGYSCGLCGGNGDRNGGIWYDKWGNKCLICQRAVDRGEVPGWAAEHHDSWYSKYDLESRFKLTTPVLKRMVKDGIIKPRNIVGPNGRTHYQLFLICDNKGFLPPKRLTESKMISEEKDGKTWFRSESWYRFVDPFEYLKGYRIMEYMRAIPPEVKQEE